MLFLKLSSVVVMVSMVGGGDIGNYIKTTPERTFSSRLSAHHSVTMNYSQTPKKTVFTTEDDVRVTASGGADTSMYNATLMQEDSNDDTQIPNGEPPRQDDDFNVVSSLLDLASSVTQGLFISQTNQTPDRTR